MRTLRRLVALAGIPRAAHRAVGLAGRARGRLRRRTHDDGRLSDLARRGAAADPLADRHDRRRPLLRSRQAARALPRASRLARRRPARAGANPRALLRAHRAARPGAARRLPPRRAPRPHGRRRRVAAGSVPARARPPLVALAVAAASVGVMAAVLPAAAAILAAGLARRPDRRPGARRGRSTAPRVSARQPRAAELTAELVELLRGAPELVVYGREDETLARIRSRTTSSLVSAAATRSPPGSPTRSRSSIAGLTVAGVSAIAVAAADSECARPRARGRTRAAGLVFVRGRLAAPGSRAGASCHACGRPPRARARSTASRSFAIRRRLFRRRHATRSSRSKA